MHCIFFRYIIFHIFLVWKGLYVIKWPLGRNERDATLEILRSSETELPILKTKLPILGRQFQNKRTVRRREHPLWIALRAGLPWKVRDRCQPRRRHSRSCPLSLLPPAAHGGYWLEYPPLSCSSQTCHHRARIVARISRPLDVQNPRKQPANRGAQTA